jgi:hypothetical protein
MANEAKQLYEFTQAGFFAGDFYKVGQRIRLFPKQAQHELHRMQPVPTVADTPKAPGRGRRAKG